MFDPPFVFNQSLLFKLSAHSKYKYFHLPSPTKHRYIQQKVVRIKAVCSHFSQNYSQIVDSFMGGRVTIISIIKEKSQYIQAFDRSYQQGGNQNDLLQQQSILRRVQGISEGTPSR